ncbi:MAG TPA: RDD family protein [Terracidiphilus sp.]|nr:RDD family protein [Terracidiphilus sp.]
MSSHGSRNVFDPHDTARAASLAGVPLAPFGRRFAAFLVDFLLVVATWTPAEIARQYVMLHLTHEKRDITAVFDFHEWTNVVWVVLYFGLFVWATNGLTPGKKLFGIRIASLTHARISLWQAIERALGYGASTLEAGFGFVQFFTARNRSCVHDRIAETIVVDERAMKKAPAESRIATHAS